MASRKRSSAPTPTDPGGGILTDDGGRPITDDGGRVVYASPTDDGQPYVLDAAGTPPLGEPGSTGVGDPPLVDDTLAVVEVDVDSASS